MKKDYILFIDSGIGGLSVLAQTLALKNINCIYFADDKHAPYGSHTKKEIIEYLTEIINNFQNKYQLKLVCIACNTATAAAIDHLRKKFPDITFVGTEPAINLAYKNGYRKIFAITTPLTSKTSKYDNLKQKINAKVLTYPHKNLAMQIEDYYLKPSFKKRFLLLTEAAKILKKASKYECIVLGCTHYSFFKPFLSQISSKTIIDGCFGVAKNIITNLPYSNDKFCKKTVVIIKSASQNRYQIKKYKKILSQTLANCNILC